MRIILHALCFLVSFSLEIHVHAAFDSSSPDVVGKVEPVKEKIYHMHPEYCLGTEWPCAIKMGSNQKNKFFWKGVTLRFPSKAFVQFNSHTDVTLISGFVVVEAVRRPVKVQTIYGNVDIHGNSLVVLRDERVEVMVLSGESYLEHEKSRSLTVPAGYMNWSYGLNAKGEFRTGRPRAANAQDMVRKWFSVYSGDRQQLVREFKAFKAVWSVAAEDSVRRDQKEIKRQIASNKKEKNKKHKQYLKWKKERDELRNMFFRKTFE